MTQLTVYGRKVDTVFDLLGNKEDDMTYSLGWALAECDIFCQRLADALGLSEGFSDAMHIRLQEYDEDDKGFTDIEIVDPDKFHIIIEAKRGFNIPSLDQLEKYAGRLKRSGTKVTNERSDTEVEKMLVVLAESDRKEKWLDRHVREQAKQVDVDVKAISWKQFQDMANECVTKTSKSSEKRLLRQLIRYLEKVTIMQNQTSSLVYVVSVSDYIIFKDTSESFIDVVEKHQKYFHPVGNGWPIEPPNYIAFRYHGKLQSIHHIDSYTVIEDFKEVKDFKLTSAHPTDGTHYLYTLGAPIRPPKDVRTIDKAKGKTKGFKQIHMARRCECFIDLLLTCDSISEAFAETKKRQEAANNTA